MQNNGDVAVHMAMGTAVSVGRDSRAPHDEVMRVLEAQRNPARR